MKKSTDIKTKDLSKIYPDLNKPDKVCEGCGEIFPVCYCDYQLEQTHDHDDCMITYVEDKKPPNCS